MDFAQISKTGSREHNEDSALALASEAGALFVVADGLGGHERGEVASAAVTETFRKNFEDGGFDANAFIADTIQKAQLRLRSLQEEKGRQNPPEMMTTCAALLISGGICRIGHVGDTRAYVFHRDKVKSRTLDHSVPQMLVLSGEIKEKRIRNHPDRNRLLRVMGTHWDSPKYELSDDVPVSECQAILLCSDGFWELCNEKKMCGFLRKSGSCAQWLELMLNEVERNGLGGDMDNYTAIAVFPGE